MKFSNNPVSQTSTCIYNATIVTDSQVLPKATLWAEDGRIVKIVENEHSVVSNLSADCMIDAEGAYLIPGIIDLHSDKLPSEITPRPRADLPFEIALQEIEQKVLACGVTTIFHAISMGYLASEKSQRSAYQRAEMVQATHEFAKSQSIARTHVHLRYEIQGHDLKAVYDAIEKGQVDLLSIMDHRPGHGQMSKERCISNLTSRGLSEVQAKAKYLEMHQEPIMERSEIQKLVEHAHKHHILVASHDDPDAEQVVEMNKMGINIAEFPLSMEAAKKACELGMTTIGGSANTLRGESLSGNLCVNKALSENLITGLCSDYYPPALIHSAFNLFQTGVMDLPKAVGLISKGPARIIGVDEELGSIQEGSFADFLIVEASSGRPKVLQTWIGGKLVHQSHQRKRNEITPFSTQISASLSS